jgi:hypothetical protein
LRDADTAMYCAKLLGKARYQIFDKNMHSDALNVFEIRYDLRPGVHLEEFCTDGGKQKILSRYGTWKSAQFVHNARASVKRSSLFMQPRGECSITEPSGQVFENQAFAVKSGPGEITVNILNRTHHKRSRSLAPVRPRLSLLVSLTK